MNVIMSVIVLYVIFMIYMRTAIGQQGCDYNKSVVVEIGGNATFVYNTTPNTTYWDYRSNLYHGSTRIMYFYHFSSNYIDTNYYDSSYKNRTNVSGYIDIHDPYPGNITITLYNIGIDDIGTYVLKDFRVRICWILYIAITSEEGSPMSLTSSVSIPEGLNNTWLIDGSVITSGSLYLISQNDFWILRIDRIMNGHNITYRATYQDGRTLEENYILNVTYGPDPNLLFNPDISTFIVAVGRAIPNITCTAVCLPLCDITWTSDLPLHDTDGARLRLGTGTNDMEGEYHCTATRKGTHKSARKTFVIIIKENDSYTTADNNDIVLGSLVGILTVGLIVAFVFIARLYRLDRTTTQDKATMGNTAIAAETSNTIAMETYTNLQPVSDSTESPYEPMQSQGEEQTARHSYYENTNVA